jgi:hypothetical protein
MLRIYFISLLNLKRQSSTNQTGLEFSNLIIGICLEFLICYLEIIETSPDQLKKPYNSVLYQW